MSEQAGCFGPQDLTDDGFLGGRLRVLQPRQGYRAATDPMLLAAATATLPGQSVLELGCGAGGASLCLAARVGDLRLSGVERQPAYADLARQNAARNHIALSVHEGDLRALPAEIRAQRFDHVIANPPYYPAAGGTSARDAGREAALREETPLVDWIAVAARRLQPGGYLTVIQAADRLPDLLMGCAGRLGSLRVLPLAARQGREANRVILQARKGGSAAFRLAAPFILHDGQAHDGDRDSLTAAAQDILRGSGGLQLCNP